MPYGHTLPQVTDQAIFWHPTAMAGLYAAIAPKYDYTADRVRRSRET
jgi:hypothetical protein